MTSSTFTPPLLYPAILLSGLKLSTLRFSLLSILQTKLVVVYLTSTDLTTKQNLDMPTTIAKANTNIQSLDLDCSCLKGEAEEVIMGVCYMVNEHAGLLWWGWDSGGEGKGRVLGPYQLQHPGKLQHHVLWHCHQEHAGEISFS